MKHTREEILNALHVIKDTCSDETIDCDNCPFGDDEDLSNPWQKPPLLSEVKVGDECRLFFY